MAIPRKRRRGMAENSDFSSRTCLAFFLCMALLFATTLAGCGNPEKPKGEPPAVEVVAITVQPRTMPAVFPFVAQIQSSHQVDVMARVSGFLEKISYPEGRQVSEGQILEAVAIDFYQGDIHLGIYVNNLGLELLA